MACNIIMIHKSDKCTKECCHGWACNLSLKHTNIITFHYSYVYNLVDISCIDYFTRNINVNHLNTFDIK